MSVLGEGCISVNLCVLSHAFGLMELISVCRVVQIVIPVLDSEYNRKFRAQLCDSVLNSRSLGLR